MKPSARSRPASHWLTGGGEAGQLIRNRDWSHTSLGAIDSWPAVLRSALDLALHSPVPMVLLWGPEGVMLYNDGYAAFAGTRHPELMGSPVLQAWPEVADFNRHVLTTCLNNETLSFRDQPLLLNRNGNSESCWFNLDYSPLRNESGQPVGVLAIVAETTDRFTANRIVDSLSQQLAHETDRLHQFFRQAPGFRAMLRGSGHIFELVNNSFVEFIGNRDIIGQSIRDALPELAGQGYFELLDQVYRTGRPFRGERLEFRMSDTQAAPQQLYVNLDIQPYTDADGTVLGIFAEGHDVTDSVRIEQSVRDSERRQAALVVLGDRLRDLSDLHEITLSSSELLGSTLNVMRAGFLRLDKRSIGAATRLGEWLADGVEPTPSMQLYVPHGTHLDEVQQGHTVAIENVATDLRTSSFKEFWQSMHVAAVAFVPVTAQGRVAAVVRVHNSAPRVWTKEETDFIRDVGDLTFAAVERARAIAALRQSEEDLRLITDGLPALISYLDNNLTYRFVNRGYEEWLGIPRDQIIGKTVTQVFGADGDSQRVSRLRCALAGQYTQYESTITTPDGTRREIELRMAPRYDASGAVQGIYTFVLDISARKRAEAELQQLNESLEHKVTERTNELRATEEQLRQSHKMEAIGQLTGGIAHDFNNILQGIIGGLEAVRRRLSAGRSDGVEQFMEAVLTSAHRAAGLTHRLLAFSRRQSLDVKAVDVNLLVRSLSELIRRTLGENHFLELDLGDAQWSAETDANQLESALLNLAINARDAMGNGGTLSIQSANVQLDANFTRQCSWLQPGDYVALYVSDTGSGMTAATLARAFDPFFTTKPIGSGTGLGLSMIYGFVRQSHGHVHIDSTVGIGTTVSIYLPRAVSATTTLTEPAPQQIAKIGDGATVLIVEDDRAVRLVVRECLRELGYQTLEAADGLEAVETLRAEHIDLLVTDVGLPGMNGRQVADVARGQHANLNVLFMTGYAEGAVQRSGFLDPGMAMIIKPFSNEAFIAKVREAARH